MRNFPTADHGPHGGSEARSAFGRADIVRQAQPPFPWSYAWDKKMLTLKKGPAKVRLAVTGLSGSGKSTLAVAVEQGVVVPVTRPFFGVMGVAPLPAMGRISSVPPGVS